MSNWLLFSSVIVIVAHKFVDRPNVVRPVVDAMPRVVDAVVHPAAVTIDFDAKMRNRQNININRKPAIFVENCEANAPHSCLFNEKFILLLEIVI